MILSTGPASAEPQTDFALNTLTQKLDTTGKVCPLPILLTARRIRQLEPGEVLEVIGDDPGIVVDMPSWCQETGHRLIDLVRRGDQIVCRVEKVAEPEPATD